MWNKVNFHVHECFNRITNLRRVTLLTDRGFIASADRRNKFVLDCSWLDVSLETAFEYLKTFVCFYYLDFLLDACSVGEG